MSEKPSHRRSPMLTIFLPSGDHCGDPDRTRGGTDRYSLPFTTSKIAICVFNGPGHVTPVVSSAMQTIFVPSGDQLGEKCCFPSRVSLRKLRDRTSTTKSLLRPVSRVSKIDLSCRFSSR